MSEFEADGSAGAAPLPAATAGSLLRQARVAKGMHIAALATLIKVAPRKLELLESDKFDELPGATFTRALAQTVCRTLKIDAAPVLALLPQAHDGGLSQMSMGLNAPYRDKPGRRTPSDLQFLKSPALLGTGLLVVASVLLYALPSGWVSQLTLPGATSGGESTTAVVPPPAVVTNVPSEITPSASATTVTEIVAPAPASASASIPAATSASAPALIPAATPVAEAASAASAPSGALLLRASAQSWVEVIDGRGLPLLARHLEAGETVGLDGPSPLRVRIGNASATQVSFRGKTVELTPSRGNVAKLELR